MKTSSNGRCKEVPIKSRKAQTPYDNFFAKPVHWQNVRLPDRRLAAGVPIRGQAGPQVVKTAGFSEVLHVGGGGGGGRDGGGPPAVVSLVVMWLQLRSRRCRCPSTLSACGRGFHHSENKLGGLILSMYIVDVRVLCTLPDGKCAICVL